MIRDFHCKLLLGGFLFTFIFPEECRRLVDMVLLLFPFKLQYSLSRYLVKYSKLTFPLKTVCWCVGLINVCSKGDVNTVVLWQSN
jgi:hypothetical protein